MEDAFEIPGFVPEYIRPLFCEGRGPFRWVALSGSPEDIHVTDQLALEMFPKNEVLERWMRLAKDRIHFQGLPARICWLGYGERAEFGLAINDYVQRGKIEAPIVIGRDHLDTGSVASPYRETEAMLDTSDAVADWPLLNALLNTAAGASWVSIHNGGGVGIGYSQHAGMVVVADGTEPCARRLERVLTTDPGIGRDPARRRRIPRERLKWRTRKASGCRWIRRGEQARRRRLFATGDAGRSRAAAHRRARCAISPSFRTARC